MLLTGSGTILILLGLWGAYFFIAQGTKPDWLQWRVFTLYCSYFETKTFTFIPNNQGDELTVVSYCMGWILILRQLKHSFLNRQTAILAVFMLGYLLLHGTAVILFIGTYLLLLPVFLIVTDLGKALE